MEIKGFTIVELLAVIGVLAILLLFAVPTVLKTKDNALKGLSEMQVKNIKAAGELLGLDLDDYNGDIYNCQSGTWVANKCLFEDGHWSEVSLSVEDLKNHNYFEDKKGHCKGDITIQKSDMGYSVDYSKVSC